MVGATKLQDNSTTLRSSAARVVFPPRFKKTRLPNSRIFSVFVPDGEPFLLELLQHRDRVGVAVARISTVTAPGGEGTDGGIDGGASGVFRVAQRGGGIGANSPRNFRAKSCSIANLPATHCASAIAQAPFPVIHIATHGQFSPSAQETFILAWDERINVNELDRLLRSRQQDGNDRAI
jgi:hypothetical protein